jgi:hypothetical protein
MRGVDRLEPELRRLNCEVDVCVKKFNFRILEPGVLEISGSTQGWIGDGWSRKA